VDRRPSAAPGRAAARRCWVLLLSALLAAPLLPLGHAPAQAGPARRTASPEQERVAQRERQALADLAESSAVVRAAAVALSGVAAELPVARSDVAKARGGLVGARARASAADATWCLAMSRRSSTLRSPSRKRSRASERARAVG